MDMDMDIGEERRGKLKLSPQLQLMPILKLTLILGIATMDMVWDTTATIADHTMVVTTGHTDMDTDIGDERRGKLKLSPQLQLMPILKLTLILGIATMDMVLDMATIADHTMVANTEADADPWYRAYGYGLGHYGYGYGYYRPYGY